MLKFKKPNQHGVWAMIIIPPTFGLVAGGVTYLHIFLYIGILASYFMGDQLLFFIKKRKKDYGYLFTSLIFFIIAIINFLPIVIIRVESLYIFLLMIPLMLINFYYAKKRNERAIINDIAAVVMFSLFGVISTILSVDIKETHIWMPVFLMSMTYFLGTIFYVKTMIREKKSIKYKYLSWIYHLLIALISFTIHPILFIMYLPSLIRAIVMYGKNIKIMKIGILEIINSLFVLVTGIIYLLL